MPLKVMGINQLIIRSLKAEASEAELRELGAWRNASPANERHYHEFVALWEQSEHGDDFVMAPPPSIADILGKDVAARPELIRIPSDARVHRSGTSGRTWRTRRQHVAVLAAAIVILVVGSWMVTTVLPGSQAPRLARGADEFLTGTSEMATVSLRDGSVVRLAPNSRLQLSGSTEAREVALRGRAYFAIAPDETHPFRIRAGAGSVTVMGTRFDLQSEGEDLRLIVVEGNVRIAAGGRDTEVGAGEMSRILGGMLIPPVSIPNVSSLVDWVGNFLAFQATPLAQAVREIEREYGVRVEIADTALAGRTVTGWFADKTLDEVLRIVCAVVAAKCSTNGEVVMIGLLPDGTTPTDTAASPRH